MKKKILTGLIAAGVLVASLGLAGCGGSDDSGSGDSGSAASGSVVIAGSTSVQPLSEAMSEVYMEENPDVTVEVQGGGSGQGIKSIEDGIADIGSLSREVGEDEKGSISEEYVIAKDGVAVIVNADVNVDDLSLEQIKGIYTGEITNWSEVGGPDEEIILISRPQTSGTRALFKEYALDGNEELSGGSLETDDSGTLLQSVADNEGAIGYVALPYLLENDTVSTVAIDGVEPTMENTYNGTYPVWGYEHMYTKGEPNEVVQAFLDFMMSEEYGEQIEAQGYCMTSKMEVER